MAMTSSDDLRRNATVIGWVSTTDVMVLFVLLLVTVAVALQRDGRRETLSLRTDLAEAKLDLTKNAEAAVALANQISDLKTHYAEAIAKANRLAEEIACLDRAKKELEHQHTADLVKISDLETRRRESIRLTKELEHQHTADLAKITDLEARRWESIRLTEEKAKKITELQQLANGLSGQLGDKSHELLALRETNKNLRKQRVAGELLGLKGPLGRVAILFDRSESMKANPERWKEARLIATTWIEKLDMDACALVIFCNFTDVYPENGTLLPLRSAEGDKNRAYLRRKIDEAEPLGSTDTAGALEEAYKLPGLQTIILFTDGQPTGPKSGEFQQSEADKVFRLCREHKKIPIHVVGVGCYFDKDFSDFLMEVARLTDGTFLGR